MEVVPREDNANGARVKMMRARRVYVGADLERLFADYLTVLACRAAQFGFAVAADDALFVNLDRPPLLAPLREATVRDKVDALRRGHRAGRVDPTLVSLTATPRLCCSVGPLTGWSPAGWATPTCRPLWTSTAGCSEDEALRAAANWKKYTSGWQVTMAANRPACSGRPDSGADPVRRLWEQTCPRVARREHRPRHHGLDGAQRTRTYDGTGAARPA